jgi:hypothetical protein
MAVTVTRKDIDEAIRKWRIRQYFKDEIKVFLWDFICGPNG